MPFAQSKKTKSHEPLQMICSPTVDASAGRKTRASAPTTAQIVVIIFAFIIWKFIAWKFISSQNRNAGDTTGKMECDHTCPQIQNTYRARMHLLKCKSQHCLMRNKVTGNLCRLSPLCKCLFSLLWKFIVKLVVCDAKVVTIFEYPNIFLLFYRKFMFLQSKNCRLCSKNYDYI